MLAFFRHLFFPHHTNGHRAKVLHHQSLAIVIVFLLGLNFVIPLAQKGYPSVLGSSVNISSEDLINLTNQRRAEAGLAPLKLNPELSKAAANKANYMFQKNFWAHIAPDGTTPWYFIKSAGYEYEYAGENLARGFDSASDVVDAWMASPTHRENMLSKNYKDVGFAVESGKLVDNQTTLVVEEFGSRYLATEPQITSVPEEVKSSKKVELTRVEQKVPQGLVKSVSNSPLIDSKKASRDISLFILMGLILILIVDLVIMERKKVVRVVAHNLDHIIFLGIILITVIIIGAGSIL